jgi:LAGLIDADG DNA endonuclease family
MLCTDSFTVQDIVRLMNVLIIRYNIISSIRSDVRKGRNKTYNRIYIHSKSMKTLREVVSPYLDNSMLYKVNNQPLKKNK